MPSRGNRRAAQIGGGVIPESLLRWQHRPAASETWLSGSLRIDVIGQLSKRGRRRCVWVNGVAMPYGRHIARGLTEPAKRGLWGGLKTAVPSAIRMDRTERTPALRSLLTLVRRSQCPCGPRRAQDDKFGVHRRSRRSEYRCTANHRGLTVSDGR
jgi:hypothetical protein